jgi:RNA polymerase sigma-70 factor (ECF subfamily)
VHDTDSLERLSDEALVERCRAGDSPSFTELVRRYQNPIHRLTARIVGDADAEDFTQDVFLRVHRALPGFRQGSTFRTWIYRIARNLCLSELRKRGRRGDHLSLDDEGEESVHRLLPAGRPDLEEEIERRDFSAAIQRLVGRLPEGHRTALTLFYMNQARYEEISEVMGIPLGTVKTYIRRGRLRLRNMLLADSDLSGLVDAEACDPSTEGGSCT